MEDLEVTVSDSIKIEEALTELRGGRDRQISLSLNEEEYNKLFEITFLLKESPQKAIRRLIMNYK